MGTYFISEYQQKPHPRSGKWNDSRSPNVFFCFVYDLTSACLFSVWQLGDSYSILDTGLTGSHCSQTILEHGECGFQRRNNTCVGLTRVTLVTLKGVRYFSNFRKIEEKNNSDLIPSNTTCKIWRAEVKTNGWEQSVPHSLPFTKLRK